MRKNLFVVFATLLVASMVLSACAPAATPAATAAPVEPTAAEVATEPVVAEATATEAMAAEPTATEAAAAAGDEEGGEDAGAHLAETAIQGSRYHLVVFHCSTSVSLAGEVKGAARLTEYENESCVSAEQDATPFHW